MVAVYCLLGNVSRILVGVATCALMCNLVLGIRSCYLGTEKIWNEGRLRKFTGGKKKSGPPESE